MIQKVRNYSLIDQYSQFDKLQICKEKKKQHTLSCKSHPERLATSSKSSPPSLQLLCIFHGIFFTQSKGFLKASLLFSQLRWIYMVEKGHNSWTHHFHALNDLCHSIQTPFGRSIISPEIAIANLEFSIAIKKFKISYDPIPINLYFLKKKG